MKINCNFCLGKAFYVLWLCFPFVLSTSCSTDSSDDQMEDETMENAPTEGDIVVGGSPWIYDTYDLIEVTDRGNSELTDQDLIDATNMLFDGAEVNFFPTGLGTETGLDMAPSSFFWELDARGMVVFTDGLGNSIEPPGEFEVLDNSISFELELTTLDSEIDFPVAHRGKAVFSPTGN